MQMGFGYGSFSFVSKFDYGMNKMADIIIKNWILNIVYFKLVEKWRKNVEVAIGTPYRRHAYGILKVTPLGVIHRKKTKILVLI